MCAVGAVAIFFLEQGLLEQSSWKSLCGAASLVEKLPLGDLSVLLCLGFSAPFGLVPVALLPAGLRLLILNTPGPESWWIPKGRRAGIHVVAFLCE